MDKLRIDVNSILEFFDENRTVSKHSNAIKTVAGEEFMFALLFEYFRRANIEAELICRSCTTGRQRGPRLDGWVKAQGKNEAEPTYYQVEVKLWSAHGVGGGARFFNPNDDLAEFKKRLWETYWDQENERFSDPVLNKVLTPMACPIAEGKIEPLACLWSPVHPEGKVEPYFHRSLTPSTPFNRVWVFSASSFLRQIRDHEPTLEMQLPEVAERIRWLNQIFVSP